MMQSLPTDSVLCWCPSWDEIKDKAHMYRTARIRNTGKHVELVGISYLSEGSFIVLVPGDSDPKRYSTEELCDFCL